MSVAIRGNSPSVLTTGILLLSRARSFGHRIDVEIVGNPNTISPVLGPAIVHCPVVAGCGVGRELGSGSLVIIPGPATDPLALSLSEDGTDSWFTVDRAGGGQHPATQAFVALCRDRDPVRRPLGQTMRRALTSLGSPAEPALLDLLFGAPVPPLTRLALFLRAGRAMSGDRSMAITRHLAAFPDELPDPLPNPFGAEDLRRVMEVDGLQPYLDRLAVRVHNDVENWVQEIWAADGPEMTRFGPLLAGLAEILSHFTSLPPQGMLPPLSPAMDAVAVGLEASLGGTTLQNDANRQLVDVFRFLGGRFVDDARFPMELDPTPAPDERVARWQWFCSQTCTAAEAADRIWRKVVDPVQ